jgi:hypothetical protein
LSTKGLLLKTELSNFNGPELIAKFKEHKKVEHKNWNCSLGHTQSPKKYFFRGRGGGKRAQGGGGSLVS